MKKQVASAEGRAQGELAAPFVSARATEPVRARVFLDRLLRLATQPFANPTVDGDIDADLLRMMRRAASRRRLAAIAQAHVDGATATVQSMHPADFARWQDLPKKVRARLLASFSDQVKQLRADEPIPIDKAGSKAGYPLNRAGRCDVLRRAAKWKRGEKLPTVMVAGQLCARLSDCLAWRPKIEAIQRKFRTSRESRNKPRNTPQRDGGAFQLHHEARKGPT